MNKRKRTTYVDLPFYAVVGEMVDRLRVAHTRARNDLARCVEHLPTLTPKQAERLVAMLTAHEKNYREWNAALLSELRKACPPTEKDITPTVRRLTSTAEGLH
jgi:phytoene dehydrogenase-like protein